MNKTEEKNIFREKIKKLKTQISEAERKLKSKVLCKKIEYLALFQNSKTVLLYWSMDDEVYTHDLVKKWSNEKKILLPAVIGDELELREFTNEIEMQRSGKYNLNEPTGKAYTAFNEIELAIIPGVAFDKNKNRLGHGKAYYDKLLPKIFGYKIGICFDFQMFDHIPYDDYDVKMDCIITNSITI